jgi:hypothetical protein
MEMFGYKKRRKAQAREANANARLARAETVRSRQAGVAERVDRRQTRKLSKAQIAAAELQAQVDAERARLELAQLAAAQQQLWQQHHDADRTRAMNLGQVPPPPPSALTFVDSPVVKAAEKVYRRAGEVYRERKAARAEAEAASTASARSDDEALPALVEIHEQLGGSVGNIAAAWYPDPQSAGQFRWWDGERWTEHVRID